MRGGRGFSWPPEIDLSSPGVSLRLHRCHEIQPAVRTQHRQHVCAGPGRIHRRAADGDDGQVSSCGSFPHQSYRI